MDSFAWLSNVLSSILIILLTKWLMTVHHFPFATTVCGLHFLSCAIAIRSASAFGFIDHVPIPWSQVLLFSSIGSVSIASANLSLLLNTVGFYQIAKLLLAPFVCAIESTFFGKRFSAMVLFCILITLIGVGIVTVNDVQSNLLGTVMAAIFVVSSGFQQIL
jgi:solute carrier family 35 protein E3